MDDLIVIILTLVFIVAGALGQLKKKPGEKNKVNDYIPEDKDDRWLLPGEEEVADIKKDKPVVNYFKEHQEESDKVYQFKDDYVSVKPKQHAFQEIKDYSEIKVKKIKFSLRKAVIYNEILNRKYT